MLQRGHRFIFKLNPLDVHTKKGFGVSLRTSIIMVLTHVNGIRDMSFRYDCGSRAGMFNAICLEDPTTYYDRLADLLLTRFLLYILTQAHEHNYTNLDTYLYMPPMIGSKNSAGCGELNISGYLADFVRKHMR